MDPASSLCAHVVARLEPVIVSDARSESGLAASPDVAGPPGVRFYAGIPVRSRAGAVLGALSICDQQVRSLEPGSVRILDLLSRQAAVVLESMDQMERFELLNRMFPPCRRCRRRNSVATEWAQVGGYYAGKVCTPVSRRAQSGVAAEAQDITRTGRLEDARQAVERQQVRAPAKPLD